MVIGFTDKKRAVSHQECTHCGWASDLSWYLLAVMVCSLVMLVGCMKPVIFVYLHLCTYMLSVKHCTSTLRGRFWKGITEMQVRPVRTHFPSQLDWQNDEEAMIYGPRLPVLSNLIICGSRWSAAHLSVNKKTDDWYQLQIWLRLHAAINSISRRLSWPIKFCNLCPFKSSQMRVEQMDQPSQLWLTQLSRLIFMSTCLPLKTFPVKGWLMTHSCCS